MKKEQYEKAKKNVEKAITDMGLSLVETPFPSWLDGKREPLFGDPYYNYDYSYIGRGNLPKLPSTRFETQDLSYGSNRGDIIFHEEGEKSYPASIYLAVISGASTGTELEDSILNSRSFQVMGQTRESFDYDPRELYESWEAIQAYNRELEGIKKSVKNFEAFKASVSEDRVEDWMRRNYDKDKERLRYISHFGNGSLEMLSVDKLPELFTKKLVVLTPICTGSMWTFFHPNEKRDGERKIKEILGGNPSLLHGHSTTVGGLRIHEAMEPKKDGIWHTGIPYFALPLNSKNKNSDIKKLIDASREFGDFCYSYIKSKK